MDIKTVLHIIFVIIIFLLIIKFYKKQIKSTFENFIDGEYDIKKVNIQDIINIFEELKIEVPPTKVLNFYLDYVIQNNLSHDQLKDLIIKNNNYDFTKNTVNEETNNNIIKVQLVYNDILFRNPNKQELSFYTNLLNTNNTFNMEKLRVILIESEEYKRMILTQDNEIDTNLPGNATDRQIAFKVNKLYNEVTGEDVSDTETLNFLKKKYIQFNLDDTKFRDFIKMYLQNKPYNDNNQVNTSSNLINIKPEDVDIIKNELLKELKESLIADRANKNITDNLENKSKTESENYLDSQNVLDTIKNDGKTVFNKDATDYCYTNYKDKNTLADEQNKRNRDELRNTCVRNIKALGKDEDMVLDPRYAWSVPQTHGPVCVGGKNDYQPTVDQTALIGTLLEDSNKSKIIGNTNPNILHAN